MIEGIINCLQFQANSEMKINPYKLNQLSNKWRDSEFLYFISKLTTFLR